MVRITVQDLEESTLPWKFTRWLWASHIFSAESNLQGPCDYKKEVRWMTWDVLVAVCRKMGYKWRKMWLKMGCRWKYMLWMVGSEKEVWGAMESHQWWERGNSGKGGKGERISLSINILISNNLGHCVDTPTTAIQTLSILYVVNCADAKLKILSNSLY